MFLNIRSLVLDQTTKYFPIDIISIVNDHMSNICKSISCFDQVQPDAALRRDGRRPGAAGRLAAHHPPARVHATTGARLPPQALLAEVFRYHIHIYTQVLHSP